MSTLRNLGANNYFSPTSVYQLLLGFERWIILTRGPSQAGQWHTQRTLGNSPMCVGETDVWSGRRQGFKGRLRSMDDLPSCPGGWRSSPKSVVCKHKYIFPQSPQLAWKCTFLGLTSSPSPKDSDCTLPGLCPEVYILTGTIFYHLCLPLHCLWGWSPGLPLSGPAVGDQEPLKGFSGATVALLAIWKWTARGEAVGRESCDCNNRISAVVLWAGLQKQLRDIGQGNLGGSEGWLYAYVESREKWS